MSSMSPPDRLFHRLFARDHPPLQSRPQDCNPTCPLPAWAPRGRGRRRFARARAAIRSLLPLLSPSSSFSLTRILPLRQGSMNRRRGWRRRCGPAPHPVRRLIWPLALQVFARAHPCFEQSRLLQASTAESMASSRRLADEGPEGGGVFCETEQGTKRRSLEPSSAPRRWCDHCGAAREGPRPLSSFARSSTSRLP
jgi:hypothetical protein